MDYLCIVTNERASVLRSARFHFGEFRLTTLIFAIVRACMGFDGDEDEHAKRDDEEPEAELPERKPEQVELRRESGNDAASDEESTARQCEVAPAHLEIVVPHDILNHFFVDANLEPTILDSVHARPQHARFLKLAEFFS